MANGNPRIQSVSREKVGAFGKLKQASCFSEIDRRVRLGWSPADIAKAIHEEFNELKDTSQKYLKKLVERYRASLPAAELSLTSPTSLVGRNALKRMAKGLDELAEVERLYDMQLARLQIDIENEKKINKLLPTTGHEVFVAMKLLKQSSDLKMDLGLVKRNLGSMQVTGQMAAEASARYGKDSVGKIIADPDARRKVLNIAERLLSLGGNASLDAVMIKPDEPEAPQASTTEWTGDPPSDVIDVEVAAGDISK